MTYSKQTWHDGPDSGTAITAARLQHIEDGLEAASLGASTAGTNFITVADAPTITFDISQGSHQRVVLGGSRFLVVTNDTNQLFTIILETGTGGHGIIWWAGINWAGGVAPTVTPTANKRDVFSFIRLGPDDYLGFVIDQGLSTPAVPAAPTSLSATAVSATEIDLAWTAPAGTGPVYTIERSTTGGGAGFAVIATDVLGTAWSDTSLSTGQHRWYRVAATTVAGSGPASGEANATTWTVPAAPTIGTAVAGNTTASVSWTPASDGGGPVNASVITPYIGGVAQTPQTLEASSPQAVTGLTNGTTYTFTVKLVNSVGPSAASAASNAVIPFALTPASAWFRSDSLTGANNSAISSWADDGSKAVPATQATGSKKPLTKTSALNGHSVAEFDGVDDTMTTSFWSSSISQPFTTFIVGKAMDLSQHGRFADGAVENQMIIGCNGPSSIYDAYGGNGIFFTANGTADTNFHIFAVTFDGTSTKLRLAGGAGVSGNSSNTLQGLTLGTGGDGSTTDVLHCQIAEVVVVPSSTLVDINGWGNALATKFALAWTTAT